MNASVEQLSALERKLTVVVSDGDINTEFEKKVVKVSKTLNIDGYRPGHVPAAEVKRRYGKGLRDETVAEMMDSSLRKSIEDSGLVPVNQPQLDQNSVSNNPGEDLSFSVTFEVYPDIQLADFATAELEKEVSEITSEDLAKGITSLQEQYATWSVVERVAKENDRVTIDFEGTIDGTPIKDGSGKDMQIVIGSKSFLPDFENGLLGIKAGDSKDFDVNFPKDYAAAELQGKVVLFNVTAHKVEERELAPIDEEFAEKLKIEDKDPSKVEAKVKSNMQEYLEALQLKLLQEKAFDWLVANHEVELPSTLVTAEVTRMKSDDRSGARNSSEEEILEMANKSIKLGLLLREVIEKNNIEMDKTRIAAKLQDLAAAFGGDLATVKRLYDESTNEGLSENLKNTVLTEQVADLIISKAIIKETKKPFSEISEKMPAS